VCVVRTLVSLIQSSASSKLLINLMSLSANEDLVVRLYIWGNGFPVLKCDAIMGSFWPVLGNLYSIVGTQTIDFVTTHFYFHWFYSSVDFEEMIWALVITPIQYLPIIQHNIFYILFFRKHILLKHVVPYYNITSYFAKRINTYYLFN